jgi:hypothetical protein
MIWIFHEGDFSIGVEREERRPGALLVYSMPVSKARHNSPSVNVG